MRFLSFNDENNGVSLKYPLHVLVGLKIIRTRAKRFKDGLIGPIHLIRVDSNMLQFKMGPKYDHWLANVIKKSFSICQFQYID